MNAEFEAQFEANLDNLLAAINANGFHADNERALKKLLPTKKRLFEAFFPMMLNGISKLDHEQDKIKYNSLLRAQMKNAQGIEDELNDLFEAINTANFKSYEEELNDIILTSPEPNTFILLIKNWQVMQDDKDKALLAKLIIDSARNNNVNLFSVIKGPEVDVLAHFLFEYTDLIGLQNGQNLLMQAILSKNVQLVEALIHHAKDKQGLLHGVDVTGKTVAAYADASDSAQIIDLIKLLLAINDDSIVAQEVARLRTERVERQKKTLETYSEQERPLNLRLRQKDAAFVPIEQRELEIAQAYLAYLARNPENVSSQKLRQNIPFKISRKELNEFMRSQENSVQEMQHSIFILPWNNDLEIIAMERGTREGVIGIGTYGKVIGLSLLGGETYCVKVLPKEAAERDIAIMQYLSEQLGEKMWVFHRSDAERMQLHDNKHNRSWVKGMVHDKTYIVQKYIPGLSLKDISMQKQQLLWNRSYRLEMALATVQAMQLLHSVNVTHGDLHGGNIMLDYDTQEKKFAAKFIDFTLASILTGKKQNIDDSKAIEAQQLCLKILDAELDLKPEDYMDDKQAKSYDLNHIAKKLQSTLDKERKHNVFAIDSELQVTLSKYNPKINKPEMDAMVQEIIKILQMNQTKDAGTYSLKLLTNLPPDLYFGCCSFIQQNVNTNLETVIRNWTDHKQAAPIFPSRRNKI